jgi:hypothetical protein
MNHSSNFNLDLFVFGLGFLFTAGAIYSTCINIFHKRITKIGLDAFFVFLIQLMIGKKNTDIIRQDSRTIKRMAILMALVSIGGINEMISFFLERIWPNLR